MDKYLLLEGVQDAEPDLSGSLLCGVVLVLLPLLLEREPLLDLLSVLKGGDLHLHVSEGLISEEPVTVEDRELEGSLGVAHIELVGGVPLGLLGLLDGLGLILLLFEEHRAIGIHVLLHVARLVHSDMEFTDQSGLGVEELLLEPLVLLLESLPLLFPLPVPCQIYFHSLSSCR